MKDYKLANPLNQEYQTIFKPWDYRRGSLTKNSLFKRMFQHLETAESISTDSTELLLYHPKKSEKAPTPPRPKRRKQENPSMSPLTLRRAYMPRPNGGKPTPPHPAAAPATAANQVQPPPAHLRPKSQTENSTTQHRLIKLTRFKPGFEWETEMELAQAFSRPPRLFKEDTCFYPWLPKPEPIVNFHLNYKF